MEKYNGYQGKMRSVKGAEMEAKKVSDNMLARLPVYLNYIKIS